MRRGTEASKVFGNYLYKLRTDAGLSMRQLAAKIETTPATVSQIEKGDRALKEPKLSAWAIGLGINEKTLRYWWRKVQVEYPEPPLIRRRTRNIPRSELETKILDLTGPERNRVLGYIDALIEKRLKN